jgi:hypothetical protein
MKLKNLSILLILSTIISCSTNNSSIVGTWKLKESKQRCSNELLQANFGDTDSELDGETTLEFYKDSTYKKTKTGGHYFSNDDNRSGGYILKDALLILSSDTIIIKDLSATKFSLVYRNSVIREVPPFGKCDNYNYYEKK